MNWKAFITGAAAGIIGGYMLREKMKQSTFVSGEIALANAKKAFKAQGPIDGSWIQLKREDYRKYALVTKIYRGGISCKKDGKQQQFEFIADAYTGRLLDVNPL